MTLCVRADTTQILKVIVLQIPRLVVFQDGKGSPLDPIPASKIFRIDWEANTFPDEFYVGQTIGVRCVYKQFLLHETGFSILFGYKNGSFSDAMIYGNGSTTERGTLVCLIRLVSVTWKALLCNFQFEEYRVVNHYEKDELVVGSWGKADYFWREIDTSSIISVICSATSRTDFQPVNYSRSVQVYGTGFILS